jgi:VanZ family protein
MDEGKSLVVNSSVNWRLLSAFTVAILIFASLLLPQRIEEMRTGYWAVEHFLAYFLAAFIVFKAWRRPFVVAGTLVFLGVLLEVLQCLNPSHSPNPLAALSSVGGVLAALPIAMLLIPRAGAFGVVDQTISSQN